MPQPKIYRKPMPNGTESPNWYCRFYVGGRRIERSTGQTQEREAQRWADQLAGRMSYAETVEDVSRAAKRALADANVKHGGDIDDTTRHLAAYLDRQGVSAKYAANVLSKWRSFVAWTDRASLAGVTRAHAQQYVDHLAANDLSGNTARRYVSACSIAWKAWSRAVGVDSGANPFEALELPPTGTVHYRAYTDAQLRKLDAATDGDPVMRTLYYLGLYTGLRKGDVCTLLWREVRMDLPEPRIERVMRKTRREVWIPIAPRLADLLRQLGPGAPEDYVCPALARMYLHDGGADLSKRWSRVIVAAKIDGLEIIDGKARRRLGYHSLRDTWAYRAFQSGVPIHVAQEVLGHENAKLTAMYGRHAGPQQVATALADMDDPLSPRGDSSGDRASAS